MGFNIRTTNRLIFDEEKYPIRDYVSIQYKKENTTTGNLETTGNLKIVSFFGEVER